MLGLRSFNATASMRKEVDSQALLEQAILSGSVEGVEKSRAQGANLMKAIGGRLPVSIAIQNGEEDVAISLLRLHPVTSLRLQPPPTPATSKSLRHELLMLSGHLFLTFMSLSGFRRLLPLVAPPAVSQAINEFLSFPPVYLQVYLLISDVVASITEFPAGTYFPYLKRRFTALSGMFVISRWSRGWLKNALVSSWIGFPALHFCWNICSRICSPGLQRCYQKFYSTYDASLDFHPGHAGAQVIDAFLSSSFQSERLILEFLNQGLISNEYILRSLGSENFQDGRIVVELWTLASLRGYEAALRRLVGLGVPVDLKLLKYNSDYRTSYIFPQRGRGSENFFDTALSMAVSQGHANNVELLLQQGADINAKDFLGRSPLQLACSDHHWMGYSYHRERQERCRLQAGNPDYHFRWHENPDSARIIDVLKRYGVDASLPGGIVGETALHEAAWAGNPHIVAALLDLAPSLLNIPDAKQRLPLHYAAQNIKATRILLDRQDQRVHGGAGADGAERATVAAARDELGNTPLHYAALGSSAEVIMLYLSIYQVDDIQAKNKDGETAYDYAADECRSCLMAFRDRVPGIRTSIPAKEIIEDYMAGGNLVSNLLSARNTAFVYGHAR